jgi:hypothetical protein
MGISSKFLTYLGSDTITHLNSSLNILNWWHGKNVYLSGPFNLTRDV